MQQLFLCFVAGYATASFVTLVTSVTPRQAGKNLWDWWHFLRRTHRGSTTIVIALLSVLLVASAWAQEPTAPMQQQRNLSPNLMKKMVGEIAEWAVCDADRDIANRQVATLQTQLDAARKEIDELKAVAAKDKGN